MAMERQTSWGVLIALYMFLGGIGAGIYTAGFIIGFTSDLKQLAVTGMLLGPIAVILGLICLLVEAGSPLHFYRLFQGLSTSWMSRGGLIQILFIVLGLGYVLPGFWLPGWLSSIAGMTLGSIALVLALALAAYHGIALTESKRIPLWSSSAMPLLFFFTSLCSGLGLFLLISMAYGSTQVVKAAGILGIAGAAFVVGALVSVWSLLSTHSSSIYVESIRKLRTPVIVSSICLFIAFLFLLGLAISGVAYLWSSPLSGVLLLAAGFIIRYSVLKGGYYLPLRIPVPSSL